MGQPVCRTRPPSRHSRDGARRRDGGLMHPAHTPERPSGSPAAGALSSSGRLAADLNTIASNRAGSLENELRAPPAVAGPWEPRERRTA